MYKTTYDVRRASNDKPVLRVIALCPEQACGLAVEARGVKLTEVYAIPADCAIEPSTGFVDGLDFPPQEPDSEDSWACTAAQALLANDWF